MQSNQLLDSFTYRFAASGVRKPERTAEELLAYVFKCPVSEVHQGSTPDPPSSGQIIKLIHTLEELAVRIENGEDPQAVLECPDF